MDMTILFRFTSRPLLSLPISFSLNQRCRREGGILHVHGNTRDSEESQWIDHVSKSIYDIARSEGRIIIFYFILIIQLGHCPIATLN